MSRHLATLQSLPLPLPRETPVRAGADKAKKPLLV